MPLALDQAFARCSPPLLALFVVAGCAALGSTQAPGSEAVPAAPAPPQEVPAPAETVLTPAPSSPAPRSRTPIEQSPVYRLLVAEMAGHRGQLDLSASHYLDIARETRDPRVVERAVRVAAFAQNEKAALEAARLWAEVAPENHEAHRILAGLYLRAGRLDEAVAEMRALFAGLKTTPAQTYSLVVEMLARERDQDLAFAAMERFVAGQEADPLAQSALASLAARRGAVDRAAAILQKVLQTSPDDPTAVLLYAQTLQSQGKAAEAVEHLSAALSRRPDDAGLRIAYGRLLVSAKRYDDAVSEFQRVVDRNPENGEARYALALLLLQTERLDEAEQQLRALATRNTRQTSARFYLGQVAETRGRMDEAISWYRQVEQGEHYVDSQVRLGVLLARQGRLEQAREQLQGVETANSRDRVRLYLVEAELLTDAGRPQDALAVHNLALEEFPEDADLLYARAMVAEKLDRLDLLEADLRAILSRDPSHVQALNALGYTLADRTDRYVEAYELISKALAQRPDDYYILDSMGWVLYRLGRPAESLEYLRRAAAQNDDAEVAAHLGEVLWSIGEQAEARRVWEAVLQRDPGNKRVLEVMRRLAP
jgi:tetratricopeptide (TPR) repeat protein